MSAVGILSQIWVYPVKSAAGVSLASSKVALRGLEYDRRWMVIEANGRLVTQRERPELALLRPSFVGSCLRLGADKMPGLELPLQSDGGEPLTVMMWKEPVNAQLVEAATDWFSTLLGGPYRLVYMPETTQRFHHDRTDTPLSFVDGNPLSLVSEASLNHLKRRLETSVDVRNFRHNLIVGGCEAYAEDAWATLQIGSLELEQLGPCVRCMLVNVDPDRGERRTEPLRTLARYRRFGREVRFGGLYRIKSSVPATLSCGDIVTFAGGETNGTA